MAVAETVVFQILVLHLLLTLPHELGHFIAARLAGVSVPEFGIGLPPKLVAVRWRGTRWSLNALPLGAFVGYNSAQARSATQRSVIALAGPMGNFAVALVCLGLFLAPVWPSDNSALLVGITFPELAGDLSHWLGVPKFLHLLLSASIIVGLFNLLPLPSLDGSKLLSSALRSVGGSHVLQRAGRAGLVGLAFLAVAGLLLAVTTHS
jgi:membrane-associated protease RseP (regulator of RpoE activity)